MGQTIEIPRARWPLYLEALNRRVGSLPVRVEVDDMEVGAQELARQAPLQEIAFEKGGSARGSLEVRVGFDGQELLHRIVHPVRLYVAYDDAGTPVCVEIESEGGVKTLVWSEHLPELPEDASAPHAAGP